MHRFENGKLFKLSDDLPRYNALSLVERLTDRGDVTKAVPLAVIDTMQEAAEVINFFLGQIQMHSPSMDGEHHYRFSSSGWPMTHLRGSNPLQATLNAIDTVRKAKDDLENGAVNE